MPARYQQEATSFARYYREHIVNIVYVSVRDLLCRQVGDSFFELSYLPRSSAFGKPRIHVLRTHLIVLLI
jgi:hypothetical protein